VTDWLSIAGASVSPVTVGSVVWLVLRGKLRPQKFIDEMRADATARERLIETVSHEWHEAYKAEHAARQEQEGALKECLELSRSSWAVLRTIEVKPHGTTIS